MRQHEWVAIYWLPASIALNPAKIYVINPVGATLRRMTVLP